MSATATGPVPASATFSDSVAQTATMRALTVAPTASVDVDDHCSTTSYSSWNGWTTVRVTENWYDATVTWPASPMRSVSGYRVMAHLANGQSVVMGETSATNRTVSARVARAYLSYQPRLSVITLTGYGWTAQTARTAVPSC
jgi:hypothetical protein